MIEFARAPAWLEDIEERRFVCWGWRDSPSGKPTKPPLKPNGAPASTSDARTWRTLPVVLKALEKQDTIDDKKLDGIGYVLTQDDRHIAFDLDHCRDPKTGTLLPWARELLARLATYTELTPSGEGARAIGTAPPGWRDKVHASLPMGENGEKVEIFYHYPRYITVTGHLAPGAPEDLGDVSAATDEILARAAPGKTDANGTRFDADADLEAPSFGDLNQTVRRISPDIGYADWVKVGLALKAGGSLWPDESRALWIEWSTSSEKYTEDNKHGVAEAKWDDLTPDGRVGYGSLVYLSQKFPAREAVKLETSEPTFAERQVEMDARAAEEWQDLMSPPGLVGDLTRYARGIAYIDAPRAALAGALATVSTLAGNQAAVAMPRGAVSLNLFVLILGPTGVGKEGANRLAHHVLGAIDQLDVKVRPASDVALHKHLVDTGGGAFLFMDEFGKKLAFAASRSGAHQSSVLTFAMELYGRALGTLESRTYGAQKNYPAVDRPYLTLLALSVPHHVIEAVTGSDVINGFLNRFLIFSEPGGAFIDEPPARFSDDLRRQCENLAEAEHIKAKLEHNAERAPRTVEGLAEIWAILPTDGARDRLLAFRRECYEKQVEMGQIGSMWARTYENAVRVAGNVAFGCYDGTALNPELTLEHAAWATRLVRKLTVEACHLIETEVADSETERDVKRMLKFVCDVVGQPRPGRWYESNKVGAVPRAQITKAFWRIDKWKRDQIIETLLEGGAIEEVASHGQSGNSTQLFRPSLD